MTRRAARDTRTCLAALVGALGLAAGCDTTEVGDRSSTIKVDPNCLEGSMKVYPSINYGGTPICLSGIGWYDFSRAWDTRSYDSSLYRGCFETSAGVRTHFWVNELEPNAPSPVVSAVRIRLDQQLTDAGLPDAGVFECN